MLEAAMKYLEVSRHWNGRVPKPMSVGKALTTLREVIDSSHPYKGRRLISRAIALQREIVGGAYSPIEDKKASTAK